MPAKQMHFLTGIMQPIAMPDNDLPEDSKKVDCCLYEKIIHQKS